MPRSYGYSAGLWVSALQMHAVKLTRGWHAAELSRNRVDKANMLIIAQLCEIVQRRHASAGGVA